MQEEKNIFEINFSAYKTSELVEKIKELVFFQRYIVGIMIKPIVLLLILWLALGAESVYYGTKNLGIALIVLAFPIAIVNGFLAGCSAFIRRIERDLSDILTLTLNLSDTILNDLQKLKTNSTFKLSDIVRSASTKVISTSINDYFDANSSFIKKPIFLIVNKIIKNSTEKAAQKIEKEFDEKMLQTTVEEFSVWVQSAKEKIEQIKSQVDNFLSSALRVTLIPLTLIRVVALFATGAILLSAYFLLR